jgi:monoterpene epsilon-lactone hydrolase
MRTALLRTVMRLVRPVLGPPVPVRVQRAVLELAATGMPLPKGVTVERATLGGRPAERLSPAGSDPARRVLLLHGGAFLTGSPRTHRVFAAHLAVAAGCDVHVLDYRRAPEHRYPAAVDDAVAALDELGDGTSVVGDSAGGALALLLARRRHPAALALVSPMTDLTLESSTRWTGDDPLIRAAWLQQGVRAFGVPAQQLRPQAGGPPLLVHVSEHERLRPEGERLGGEQVLLPGLWHDAHLQAALLPQAAEAVASMGRWLKANG